jgi:hypothetical protein
VKLPICYDKPVRAPYSVSCPGLVDLNQGDRPEAQ